MPHILRTNLRLALLGAMVGAVACDGFGRYLDEAPEDRLVDAAVGAWAAHGVPFLDGVSGEDTVASLTPTGARDWEVAVVPPSGGVPTAWALEIPRVEVYPVFRGDAFAAWLEDRARALGLSTYLPPDVAQGLRSGDIRAVGDIEARYGPASRSLRTTVERVAYLVPRPYSDETEWHVQPDPGSAAVLIEALKLVADEMIHGDPDVRSCMGGGPPSGVERSVQLDCLAEVLGRRFGEG